MLQNFYLIKQTAQSEVNCIGSLNILLYLTAKYLSKSKQNLSEAFQIKKTGNSGPSPKKGGGAICPLKFVVTAKYGMSSQYKCNVLLKEKKKSIMKYPRLLNARVVVSSKENSSRRVIEARKNCSGTQNNSQIRITESDFGKGLQKRSCFGYVLCKNISKCINFVRNFVIHPSTQLINISKERISYSP